MIVNPIFVNDIVMPLIGHFTSGMDFADLKIVLTPEVVEDGVVVTNRCRWMVITIGASPGGNTTGRLW